MAKVKEGREQRRGEESEKKTGVPSSGGREVGSRPSAGILEEEERFEEMSESDLRDRARSQNIKNAENLPKDELIRRLRGR